MRGYSDALNNIINRILEARSKRALGRATRELWKLYHDQMPARGPRGSIVNMIRGILIMDALSHPPIVTRKGNSITWRP